MSTYDSTAETLKHIKLVSEELTNFSIELLKRGQVHDQSKLEPPEKELFDELTPILSGLTYNSPEYKESLNRLKPALDHHYANNSHHPQFYPNGIDGMTLCDVIEMYCDWLAAVKRTKDGNIETSIQVNKERFGMSEQLCTIFLNTVKKEDEITYRHC